MTVRELSQLYYLKREIKGLKEKIYKLQSNATDTSAKITDGLRGSDTSDKVGKAVAEIVYYKQQLNERSDACRRELIKLEKYISDCDDSLTRQILTYRFVDCLTWGQIAVKIGGGNTPDGCRMKVLRYLRRN